MSDEEQDAVLQLLAQEEHAEALNYSEKCDFKLVDGKNDATAFLPLTIKGGPYISNKCGNKSSKFPKQEPTKFFTEDKTKITSDKVNARHEINSHTIQKEIIKDLEIKSYKDAMLKEPDRKRDLVPMEEWSILSDYVKYIMHGESGVF